jgi:hypothetical protein
MHQKTTPGAVEFFFVTYKWHDLVSPNQQPFLNCPVDLVIKGGLQMASPQLHFHRKHKQ